MSKYARTAWLFGAAVAFSITLLLSRALKHDLHGKWIGFAHWLALVSGLAAILAMVVALATVARVARERDDPK